MSRQYAILCMYIFCRPTYQYILLQSYMYTVRINKKVIHFQRPIVLKSTNLNIRMWHISKEQLILFPLVPFLYHVCHAWPSILPLKMPMSLSTFCKFCELDKRVIAKQCNGVAAENVTSHEIWTTGYFQLLLVILRIIWSYLTWINGCLGNYLAMVRQDMQDMRTSLSA